MLKDASVELEPARSSVSPGLLGSGRTELARALFGADKPDKATLILDGGPSRSHRHAMRSGTGIGYCSEDRKADGIIP